MNPHPQPNHHRDLDGLRGVAIALVLALHTLSAAQIPLAWILKIGWTGVDLFFVLSGFLITGILLRTREEPRYYLDFYAKRALRIWPLISTLFRLPSGPMRKIRAT